jgi:putative membrane protein
MMAHIAPISASGWLLPSLLIFVPLGMTWLYLRGLLALPGVSNRWRRFFGFAAGAALLVVVFSPPVDTAADSLFSAHMAQHVLLIVAIPILFTYSHTLRYMLMGLPRGVRHYIHPLRRAARRMTRWVTIPAVAVFFAASLWVWHVPVLYDAALGNIAIHALEHADFLLAGFLFWSVAMDPRREFVPKSILIFGTAFQSGLLGALLVLAPRVLYRSHLDQTLAQISPLQDQQVAGLIMWVPMGAVFLVTVAAMVLRALGSERGLVGDA